MKKKFLDIYRCLVGPERGFFAEGSEQWYYSLAVAISLMITWWKEPKVGYIFMILAGLHYVTVFIYGFFDFCDMDEGPAYSYLVIHLVIWLTAIFVSFKWAMIGGAITSVALLLAPDCTANNVFLRKPDINHFAVLLCHTIILGIFVVIDFLLPIRWWIKVLLLLAALVLHPIIDYLEGECVDILGVTYDVRDKILYEIRKNRS